MTPCRVGAGRKGYFDHDGIAAGPQAERLSDGNYLYLYNIVSPHGSEDNAACACACACVGMFAPRDHPCARNVWDGWVVGLCVSCPC